MSEKLPKSGIFIYSIGQLGWSILVNIVSLQLVYFYIPPISSGIPLRITQAVFLVVLNALTLIAASGRIFDAVTDPIIANLSDKWKGKRGRRVPFMTFGAIPAAIFCTLMFIPIVSGVSSLNIVWLFFMQVLFYLFLTCYVTPFFALLPELGHTTNEKLNLSTWISVTYAIGIVIASLVQPIAKILPFDNPITAVQVSIGMIAFVAMIFMLVPALFLNERKYVSGTVSSEPLFESLKRTFKNKSFKYYVVADFSYFMGLTIIMTGLLYYITVLLGLSDGIMGFLMPLMIVVSFVFYPLVNILAKKFGKKTLIIGSFFFMGLIFFFIYFMGKVAIPEKLQAYLVVVLYSIPLSFLGVLPNAVLADIAEHDALKNGINQEGMFFAARTLMQKFGQTFGVLTFAALTSLGKDPGDDLGIRISGLVGFVLCFVAGTYFVKYNEKKIITESNVLRLKV
ncbi:MFS transporter [Thiospirochaeta perfilievii]|uniref:MFS transporter n=1 Tax=Thiospirochaeta perfilievii TaxID=252967 RepID=A0A5C1QE73_9SPIO|nr:MFS transporter [Thiospirochaeta perfilievii]QEN05360.1 MFS transporter [Thiospirochaeta perfilievii]